jgi:hypothetical protein
MGKFTQARNPISVQHVESCLHVKIIWTTIQEYTQENGFIDVYIVVSLLPGKIIWTTIQEFTQAKEGCTLCAKDFARKDYLDNHLTICPAQRNRA